MNEVFGRWQVLGRDGNKAKCLCSCGTIKSVNYYSLKCGDSTSCGCRRKEVSSTLTKTHGLSNSPTHKVWMKMNARCNNPNYPEYYLYGGRGIKVCERWSQFENFLEDMKERPVGLQIDRIDVNGPYAPDNCRWVTQLVNSRNKRNSVMITWNGVTLHIAEWAEKLGIKYKTIKTRYRQGWSVDRMLSQEVPR
jgi:hypothetical protein